MEELAIYYTIKWIQNHEKVEVLTNIY